MSKQKGDESAFGVAAGSPSVDSALRELHGATESLMEIVEGFRGERWAANGKRLVDTPEWCRFYVARCAVNRAQENNKIRDGEDGVPYSP